MCCNELVVSALLFWALNSPSIISHGGWDGLGMWHAGRKNACIFFGEELCRRKTLGRTRPGMANYKPQEGHIIR